jgi:hypothetical protein
MRHGFEKSRYGAAALVVAVFALVSGRANAAPPPDASGDEFLDTPVEALPKPAVAATDDEQAEPGHVPGYNRQPEISLAPTALQFATVLPTGVTPQSTAVSPSSHDFKMQFSGYIQGGLRAGIGSRSIASDQQHKMTLHADPVVAGASWGWFDHTNTVPGPWGQLNFKYGNDVVSANAVLGAWGTTEAQNAAAYYLPPVQQWFTDAYLMYTPHLAPVGLTVKAGVYRERYGSMAQYTDGAYSVPAIAVINGVGSTATVELPFEGDLTLRAEAGFKGTLNRAMPGLVPDGSNENARPIEGSTYAAHGHLGFGYKDVWPTFHIIHAFSQDDRSDDYDDTTTPQYDPTIRGGTRKDGTLDVYGVDVRYPGGRFGHLVAAVEHVVGKNMTSMSNLVQILYSGSGRDFNERWWSYYSNGTGKISLAALQYTVSLGTLLRYPEEFWGEAPDLTVSVFGIYAHSVSGPEVDGPRLINFTANPATNLGTRDMLKMGVETLYSVAPWLAIGDRIDYVAPALGDSSKSYQILTQKLVIRSDWTARETLVIQYSGWLLGDNVHVNGDNRLMNYTSARPDRHMLAIYGTMWW